MYQQTITDYCPRSTGNVKKNTNKEMEKSHPLSQVKSHLDERDTVENKKKTDVVSGVGGGGGFSLTLGKSEREREREEREGRGRGRG